MKDIDQKHVGLRIKAVRILTGLNQEEFARACNFNYTSIRNWEFGRFMPRENAVMGLIGAFQKYGIQASFNWLMYGSGEGPVFSSTTDVGVLEESNIDNLVTDFYRLSALKNNRILKAVVNSDDMRPIYRDGDLLLAIAQPLESLLPIINTQGLSSPFLVKIKDGRTVPRYLVCDGTNWWGKLPNNDLIEPVVSNWAGKIVVRIAGDIIESKKADFDHTPHELSI